MTKPEKVFYFDINHRIYHPPEPGRIYSSGGPIWRKHWREVKVTGETSRSWVLENGRKIPKVGALPHGYAFTEAEIDDLEWVKVHALRISEEVRRCDDHATLRQIAVLIGYVAKP